MSDTDTLPGAVSIKTAAAILELSDKTLRAAINRGDLRAKRVGTHLRISRADLAAWFEALDDAQEAI